MSMAQTSGSHEQTGGLVRNLFSFFVVTLH